jgi:hypothetical protein
MAGGPGRGLSGARDEDSVLVAVVGWHRDGWWACCVGGAVVTFDMSGLGAAIGVGATLRTCTDVEGRKRGNDTAGPAGGGDADGRVS